MIVDYDAAYRCRLTESVLDQIELELGQDPRIVELRTTGLILSEELAAWEARARQGLTRSGVPVLLDVGCGLGAFGRHLSHIGLAHLIGIDLSPVAVAAARAAFSRESEAHFFVRPANDTDLTDASIGAAIALDVLHLIDGAGGVCAELVRVLAPGGTLTATTFSSSPGSPEPWVSALRQAGFATVTAREITAPWKHWMYRRHRHRLDRQPALEAELGTAAAGYLALARHAVGDGERPGALETLSRWWLQADR